MPHQIPNNPSLDDLWQALNSILGTPTPYPALPAHETRDSLWVQVLAALKKLKKVHLAWDRALHTFRIRYRKKQESIARNKKANDAANNARKRRSEVLLNAALHNLERQRAHRRMDSEAQKLFESVRGRRPKNHQQEWDRALNTFRVRYKKKQESIARNKKANDAANNARKRRADMLMNATLHNLERQRDHQRMDREAQKLFEGVYGRRPHHLGGGHP